MVAGRPFAVKPNTFDDQAAVADFLADGFVDSTRIVSGGLSAGGLLQGALYSQRPERFTGIVAEVPFVDVVVTMSDPSLPLTIPEWDEWGKPAEPGDRALMMSYSPVDNPPSAEVRPALLVTGAVHDTRVLVREPAKWVATLRAGDPDHGAGIDPTSAVSRRTVLFRAQTGPVPTPALPDATPNSTTRPRSTPGSSRASQTNYLHAPRGTSRPGPDRPPCPPMRHCAPTRSLITIVQKMIWLIIILVASVNRR